MPIVDVEVVLGAGETLTANMASMLADAIGEVFGTPRGRTWVRLRHLNRADYAEQGGITDDIRPVFITVLKSQRPENETMRHEIAALANEVARIVNRSPDNIHVLYEPDAHGRIAFGGDLVE